MTDPTFRVPFGGGPVLPLAFWLVLVAGAAGTIVEFGMTNPNGGAASAVMFIAVCAAVGSYLLAVHALAFTQCTDTEIRTRHFVRRRRCPWQQISDITVEPFSRGRRPARSVRVTTTAGKSFRLGAPVDGELIRDPDFDSALITIRICWRKGVVKSGRWHL